MIVLVIVLGIAVVVLGYTTFNLLRKNEKQEDILASYLTYLNKISDIIDASVKKNPTSSSLSKDPLTSTS